jgi:hypothetical protein
VAGLDCTTGRNRERNGGHTFIVWHVGDYDKIIVAEAVPTTNQFATNRFARLSPTDSTRFCGFFICAAHDSPV